MHWVWKPDSGRWHMLSALLSCCHGAQFCIQDVTRTLAVRRPPWPWRSKGDLGVILNFSFISCMVLSLHLFLPIQLVCGVHHSIHNVLRDYETAAKYPQKMVKQYIASVTACIICSSSCCKPYVHLVCHSSLSFFPRTLMVLKLGKRVSKSKCVPSFPSLHSEAIALQLFPIAWSLVLFTVLFKMGILD